MTKTTEKIKTFLQYRMWLILLIFLFTFVSFYWVLHAINAYKPEEKFSIFAECYGVKNQETFDSIDQMLNEKKVPSFQYYLYSPEDKDIASYYSRFGVESDIVILKEKDLLEMEDTIMDHFMILNDVLDASYANYEYYSYESHHYALKVFSKNDDVYNQKITLTTVLNFTSQNQEDYYLLINHKSVHFSKKTSVGYEVINALLN